MARESVSVTVKLYKDDPTDTAIVEFLKDKPNTFIFKEALKMYMTAYEGIMDGNASAAKPTNSGKKFFDGF